MQSYRALQKRKFDKNPKTKKSYQKVQKWVSANLYPLFKGENPSKVSVADIKAAIDAVLQGQRPQRKKEDSNVVMFLLFLMVIYLS